MIWIEAEGIGSTLSRIDSAWVLIGQIFAGLTIIVGLWKIFDYIRSKLPSTKLENRIAKAENRLEQGDKRFDDIDRKIKGIEEKVIKTQDQVTEVNKGIQMLGKAEISLFNHLIDGNGVDGMRKEVKELTDYFIDR